MKCAKASVQKEAEDQDNPKKSQLIYESYTSFFMALEYHSEVGLQMLIKFIRRICLTTVHVFYQYRWVTRW